MAKSVSTGEQTSTALQHSGPAYLTGVQVITDGTNDAKLVIDDSTDGSGRVVYEGTVVGANNYGGRNWTAPIEITTGIYCTITGTGASYIVEYM